MTRHIIALASLLALTACPAPLAAPPDARASSAPPADDDAVDATDPPSAGVTLAEDVAEPALARGAPDPRRLSLVIHVGDDELVVLDAEPREEWARGPRRALSDPSALVGARDVDVATLSPTIRARAAERWRLVGTEGETCVATLGAPMLVRRSEWMDAIDDDPDAAEAQLARVWEDGTEVLAAIATPSRGECERSLFAHVEGSPPAITFAPQPALAARDRDADLARHGAVIDAFVSLPAQHAIAARYDDYVDEMEGLLPGEALPRSWITYTAEGGPTVRFFRSDAGREIALVVVDPGGGCGDFGESLFGLFEVRRDGDAISVTTIESGDGDEAPAMLVDVEADGQLELVRWEELGYGPRGARTWVDVSAPYFGCPC